MNAQYLGANLGATDYESRLLFGSDDWLEPWLERNQELRRRAEREADRVRESRAQVDWLRKGGFVILNAHFAVADLRPRAAAAWLIRNQCCKGPFPHVRQKFIDGPAQ